MQNEQKRLSGRPRRHVDTGQLRRLRDQGYSLRQAARELGLGYGTVHRAVQSLKSQPGLIQNPVGEVL
jgi:transposase